MSEISLFSPCRDSDLTIGIPVAT